MIYRVCITDDLANNCREWANSPVFFHDLFEIIHEINPFYSKDEIENINSFINEFGVSNYDAQHLYFKDEESHNKFVLTFC